MAKPRNAVQRTSALRWVHLSELMVDPQTQRGYRAGWVQSHLADFDPEQIGYIVVNRRANGNYFIVDGQHRVELLRAVGWGDQMVQCEVFEGLSQSQEAELFLARNDRIAVRPFDKFRVAVTAGDEAPCDIDRIVRAQGLVVSDQLRDGHVIAVVALRHVYDGAGIGTVKDGPAALARTLKAILKAWGRQASGFQGAILEGLGMVELRYDGKIDQEGLAEKLAPFPGGAPGLLGKAKAMRDVRGRPVHHCVAAIVVDIYNKGKRDKGKTLEDWWK